MLADTRTKRYDADRRELRYFVEDAKRDLWDSHWEQHVDADALRKLLRRRRRSWQVRLARRYLTPGDGPILEGGCGVGAVVAQLSLTGYTCIGVDSAKQTVAAVNQYVPELDIRLGELEALEFDDAVFAGYWSQGVIEHCPAGYEKMAAEMARVIRPGGFLFLSFPYMNPVRRAKARLGRYEAFTHDPPGSRFYQFALRPEPVRRHLEGAGFDYITRRRHEALMGLRDDILPFDRTLTRLVELGRTNRWVKPLPGGLNLTAEILLRGICAHSVALVLRRRG